MSSKKPKPEKTEEKPGAPKTLAALLPDDCRWPIGDPQAAGFRFCGKRKQAGHPYCEAHASLASTPSRPRAPYRPHRVA